MTPCQVVIAALITAALVIGVGYLVYWLFSPSDLERELKARRSPLERAADQAAEERRMYTSKTTTTTIQTEPAFGSSPRVPPSASQKKPKISSSPARREPVDLDIDDDFQSRTSPSYTSYSSSSSSSSSSDSYSSSGSGSSSSSYD